MSAAGTSKWPDWVRIPSRRLRNLAAWGNHPASDTTPKSALGGPVTLPGNL